MSSRYFGSAFAVHASAECILDSFTEALTEVFLSSLLQVSINSQMEVGGFTGKDMNENLLIDMLLTCHK